MDKLLCFKAPSTLAMNTAVISVICVSAAHSSFSWQEPRFRGWFIFNIMKTNGSVLQQ